MKQIIHYLLYPMWKVLYSRPFSFQVYSNGEHIKMVERTTWHYERSLLPNLVEDRVWKRVRGMLKRNREEDEDNGDFWADRITHIPEIKRGLKLYEKEEK